MTAIPPAELVALAGVLGLLVGSFLNVVVCRVPAGESVVRPGSRCPACSAAIRGRHNVPVISYLILRGRCATCATSISMRYPLVELVTAIAFALVSVRMTQLKLAPALPAFLYLAAVGIALALIDIDHRRLPNAIVLPAYPIAAALLVIASAITHDWDALARAAISAGALFAFYFAIACAYPAGMGFGDVKLAGVLGGVLGYLSWSALVVGAFSGFFIGALVGVVALARGASRRAAIPFGPSMIAGAFVGIFAANHIADWHLLLTGRA